MAVAECASSDFSEQPHPKWILGIVFALIGSVANAIGFVMQKWGHLAQERADRSRRWPEIGAIIISPMWVSGFLLQSVLSFPLDLGSLMFMPQTINAALGAVTIVCSQVLAPLLLGEHVTPCDWAATWVLVVGVVFVTAFGSKCTKEYTVDEMIDFWGNPVFIVVEVTVPLLIGAGLLHIYLFQPRRRSVAEETKRQWIAVTYSVMAGIAGGQQNVFFKATGELLEMAMFHGDWSGFIMWEGYVFIVLTVGTAVFQLHWINLGIKYWHVSKTYPVYVGSLILLSTLYGGAYYQEYLELSVVGTILFPVGVLVVVLGAVLLSVQPEPTTKDKDKPPVLDAEGQRPKVVEESVSNGEPEPKDKALVVDAEAPALAACDGEAAEDKAFDGNKLSI